MSSRSGSFLAIVAVLLLAACAPAAQPAPTAPAKPTQAAKATPAEKPAAKVAGKEVRVGWNLRFPTWALQMAVAHDSFNKAGLKATMSEFNSPPQIVEGMLAGALDVGVSAGPNYLAAREKGAKVIAVGLLTGHGYPPTAYYMRKDSGMKSVKDLKGKTMGVNNYAGNYDLYLRYMLEKQGIDPKQETIVEVPDAVVAQALLSNQIDLGAVSSSLGKSIELTQGDKLGTLFTYRDIDLFKDKTNALILVMNESFIRENLDAARAFIGTLVDEVAWMQKNPQEALKTFSELTKNPAVLQQEKPNDYPDGLKIDLPSMQHDVDLAVKFGYLKTAFKAQEVVDHSLIDEYLKSKGGY